MWDKALDLFRIKLPFCWIKFKIRANAFLTQLLFVHRFTSEWIPARGKNTYTTISHTYHILMQVLWQPPTVESKYLIKILMVSIFLMVLFSDHKLAHTKSALKLVPCGDCFICNHNFDYWRQEFSTFFQIVPLKIQTSKKVVGLTGPNF